MRAFIGAATAQGGGSPIAGISVVDLNDPGFSADGLVATVDSRVGSPMYLTLSPDGRRLYASHAVEVGQLTAWQVRGMNDDTPLKALGDIQPTHGRTPCHISIAAAGRHVLNADYGSGSVTVHPILDDGALGPATDLVQHTGAGPTDRQLGPHAHMIVTDPHSGHILAVDLGADTIFRYRLDETSGQLEVVDTIGLPAGAGPRHLVIIGRRAYVANELDSTVSVVDLGSGRVLSTVSTLDDGSTVSYPSAIRASVDGRYLIVANRGPDTIAVLSVGGDTVKLVNTVPTGGEHPRDLTMSPNGAYMYVANQFSDSITSFRFDSHTGAVTPIGEPFKTPSPACIVFADMPA